MLKFQVLDRRHKGYGAFAYRIEITGLSKTGKIEEFHKIRTWCWETFGPGIERDEYMDSTASSRWAWHVDRDSSYYIPYIYLAIGGPESLFRLKWM